MKLCQGNPVGRVLKACSVQDQDHVFLFMEASYWAEMTISCSMTQLLFSLMLQRVCAVLLSSHRFSWIAFLHGNVPQLRVVTQCDLHLQQTGSEVKFCSAPHAYVLQQDLSAVVTCCNREKQMSLCIRHKTGCSGETRLVLHVLSSS